mgnify:CR=1 FL=1
MKFDLPKDNASIIKVLGIGGGGSNAVNHMYEQGIKGVDFMVCNTDQQALDISPVPLKVQLGATLTEGRGAGSRPEVGKNAAIETIDDIKDIISSNTKMVFITAGMGGGTGTGAAPVIAKTAKEMGVLTVGIVTMPFFFEGKRRRQQAEAGIEEIRQNVDTLLIINNEKLREICGNLPIAKAFGMADNVLTTAAKGIAEIITRTGYINVDFEDVRTVMQDSGVAIMGSAVATGEDRALKSVEDALSSQLLNDNNIEGARFVLLNIAFGNQEVLMDEITEITDYIQDEAGDSAEVIWGYGHDESLGDGLSVTIIATGFNQNDTLGSKFERKSAPKRIALEDAEPVVEPAPVVPVAEEPLTQDVSPEPFLKEESTPAEQAPVEETPAVEEPVQEQRFFEFNMDDDESTMTSDEASEPEPFLKNEEADTSAFHNPASPVSKTPLETSPEEETKEWEPFIKQAEAAAPKPQIQSEPELKSEPQNTDQVDPEAEDQAKVSTDRFARLRDLSMRLRTPSGMADLENEPAFKRKQINLEDVPHSSESSTSRFSIGEEENEGEKRNTLRSNNSFLHDNVD